MKAIVSQCWRRGLRFPAAMLLAVVMIPLARANQIEFTYNTGHEDSKVYGFGKKETYDIAIKIDDPTYVGMRVKSLKVDLPVKPEWIDGCTGWISSSLKLENKQNVADLASCPGKPVDEVLTVDFTSPVTIPADGLYVGYSFNVVELGEYSTKPICVIEGKADNGLWVHTSRSRLKWCNLGEELQAVSTMTVTLEGDFADLDFAPILPSECYAAIGEENIIQCPFINRGSVPVTDIAYTYSTGDENGVGTYHFDKAVPCGRDNQVTVGIQMNCPQTLGIYPLELTVTEVNGRPNGSEAAKGSSNMVVMPLIPVNRPLVEEYTGLNCKYCPVGYVAMEQMKQNHGDEFVGLVYHAATFESPGAMCTVDPNDFPMVVNSFPNGSINRDKLVDPGYFTEIWDDYRSGMPVAEVDAQLVAKPDEAGLIEAVATLTFVRDIDPSDYTVSIAIVADGLQNPAWKQANAYSGDDDPSLSGPLWEIFTKGDKDVEGLTFNDVVVYYKDIHGISGSVPSVVKAGEKVTCSIDLHRSDIVNLKGIEFVNQDAMLKAVAILLDSHGKPVNCNKSLPLPYSSAGITESWIDSQPVESLFYDLTGRPVNRPEHGAYIRVDRMADKSIKTAKVML